MEKLIRYVCNIYIYKYNKCLMRPVLGLEWNGRAALSAYKWQLQNFIAKRKSRLTQFASPGIISNDSFCRSITTSASDLTTKLLTRKLKFNCSLFIECNLWDLCNRKHSCSWWKASRPIIIRCIIVMRWNRGFHRSWKLMKLERCYFLISSLR